MTDNQRSGGVSGKSSVDQHLVDVAVDIADGFFPEVPIDWERLLDRLEQWTGHDFGSDMDSSEIRALKRAVRKIRRPT